MSTHNICFHGEIGKISILLNRKKALTSAMAYIIVFTLNIYTMYLFSIKP